MANFSGPLVYERLTDKWVVLCEDLHFYFTLEEALGGHRPYLRELLAKTGLKKDQTIHVTAPKGFVSDLASIPKSLHSVFKPDGPWAPAAVIHDMVYQSLKEKMVEGGNTPIDKLNRNHTRLLADRLFLMGMRCLGVGWLTRMSMYNAVRAFGKSSYGGTPMVSDYGVWNLLEREPRQENYPIFRTNLERGVPLDVSVYKTNRYEYHTVKYPNLKRAFLFEATLNV